MNGVEFLLDTNVVIGLLKGHDAAVSTVEATGLDRRGFHGHGARPKAADFGSAFVCERACTAEVMIKWHGSHRN